MKKEQFVAELREATDKIQHQIAELKAEVQHESKSISMVRALESWEVSRTNLIAAEDFDSLVSSTVVLSLAGLGLVKAVESMDPDLYDASTLKTLCLRTEEFAEHTPIDPDLSISVPVVGTSAATAITAITTTLTSEERPRNVIRIKSENAKQIGVELRIAIAELTAVSDGQNEHSDQDDEDLKILIIHLNACADMLKNHLISRGLLNDTITFVDWCKKHKHELALAAVSTLLSGVIGGAI